MVEALGPCIFVLSKHSRRCFQMHITKNKILLQLFSPLLFGNSKTLLFESFRFHGLNTKSLLFKNNVLLIKKTFQNRIVATKTWKTETKILQWAIPYQIVQVSHPSLQIFIIVFIYMFPLPI